MTDAYEFLYNGTLIVIGVLLLFCLIPLCLLLGLGLALIMDQGLRGTALFRTLSFLAVVLLTKIYMGVYREKRPRREAAENQAKEGESHE